MYKDLLVSTSWWAVLISCSPCGYYLWSGGAIYHTNCSSGNLDDVWRVDNLIQFTPSKPLDELRDYILGTIDGHRHIIRATRNETWWCCYLSSTVACDCDLISWNGELELYAVMQRLLLRFLVHTWYKDSKENIQNVRLFGDNIHCNYQHRVTLCVICVHKQWDIMHEYRTRYGDGLF